MVTLEELLAQVLALREEIRAEKRLPTVLTYRMAARELSVGLTKLRELVAEGLILTTEVGDRKMIGAGEVLKFAARTKAASAPRSRATSAGPVYDAKAEAEKMRAAMKARRKKPSRKPKP